MKRWMSVVLLSGLLVSNLFGFSRAREFKDYHFMLKGTVPLTVPLGGPLLDEEGQLSLSIPYSDGTVKTGKPTSSSGVGLGFDVEFLKDGRLGITVGLHPLKIHEYVTIGGGSYQKYSFGGTLIEGGSFDVGVNLHGAAGNQFKGIGDVFVGLQVGYIWGTLFPYIPLQDFIKQVVGVDPSVSYSLKGYSLSVPIGFNYIVQYFSIGMGLSYHFYNFFSSESLKSLYNNKIDQSIILHTLSIDLSLGIVF